MSKRLSYYDSVSQSGQPTECRSAGHQTRKQTVMWWVLLQEATPCVPMLYNLLCSLRVAEDVKSCGAQCRIPGG